MQKSLGYHLLAMENDSLSTSEKLFLIQNATPRPLVLLQILKMVLHNYL